MAVKKHGNNYAIMLPSISQMYVLAHAKEWPRQPFPFKGLNFLDETSEYYYPFALYSAGHAYLDPAKSDEREPMIQGRDRSKTVMVGDSGGFQAATGVLDFDWDDPLSQKSMDQRMALLKWLEHTADYSMVLDWPAWAIDIGRLPDQLKEKDPTTGQVTNNPFQNCLNGTVWNNHFFMKHRTPGKTKFLNVLQGRNVEEVDKWYDAVTPFSDVSKYGERAFEGWALGGSTGGDPTITMRLMIKLRDQGLLDGDDRWIHVLGRSRLTTAAYLTAFNQALVEHVNPNIQISYDAASAFLYAVNGNYVTDWQITPKGMNVISTDIPMGSQYIAEYFDEEQKRTIPAGEMANTPFIFNGVSPERLADPNHFKSTVSKGTKMSDFILPPSKQAIERGKSYSMDTASYYYIMGHNVQTQLEAIADVNRKMDLPHDEAVNHIPTIFLEFKEFINELLTTEKPMEMLEKSANKFSNLISGERPGVSAYEDQTMFKQSGFKNEVLVKEKPAKPGIVESGLFS